MIEAMCANLPILAIDSKGSNELLKNNINGYFFSLQNNNFLKKIKLIKKKKLNLNKLKKYNKKYVINFDLEGSTNKLVDVYKNI